MTGRIGKARLKSAPALTRRLAPPSPASGRGDIGGCRLLLSPAKREQVAWPKAETGEGLWRSPPPLPYACRRDCRTISML
jgi:hypothetical protein